MSPRRSRAPDPKETRLTFVVLGGIALALALMIVAAALWLPRGVPLP